MYDRLVTDSISFLSGSEVQLTQMQNLKVAQPFGELQVSFISSLSDSLRKDVECRLYPDVFAFAFWCRHKAIMNMKSNYADQRTNCRVTSPEDTNLKISFAELETRRGRGVVLHYAPANIPIHFAYLLVLGLLSGNANILRISSKHYPEAGFIINHINSLLLSGFKELAPYILICQFDHTININNRLARLVDARMIWGGDQSIANIAVSTLSPGGIDISFAHRYSLCIIDAAGYIDSSDKQSIASRFFKDTMVYDQKACSSAMLVYWIGSQVQVSHAQAIFWELMEALIDKQSNFEPAKALIKYDLLCTLASTGKIVATPGKSNRLTRVQLIEALPEMWNFQCQYGFFLEYTASDLVSILPFCDKKLQTVTYYGMSSRELHHFFTTHSVGAIDRITPIGNALDFSLVWDGTDLIELLSKKRTLL